MNSRETLKINTNGHLEIGGVDCTDLVTEYNTPLYLIDEQHLENMCKSFSSSLKKYYPKGKIFYASKAFCCKYVYSILKKYDMGADAVSLGEMYTALSSNFSLDNIILHGNNKSFEELDYAVKNKAKYIVLDSESELYTLDYICSRENSIQEVLIRVNPGVEAHTHHYIQTANADSKFGFSLSNNDADKFIKKVLNCKNVKLVGLHCHIGSQIFENKSFLIALNKMCDYYNYLKKTFNISLSVFDLGGGFGIYYKNPDPKLKPIDYENQVKSICERLIELCKEYKLDLPYLILEPGRSIIGEAGITLYKAGSIKKITGIKDYIAINGGMFENPRYALYQAQYTVLAATKMNLTPMHKYSIAGKCCESGDLIAEDVMLPEINSGDIIAVLSTGAYNYSMASNYNRNLIPPIVAVKNGKSKIIVKGQTLEDLVKNDL